MALHFLHFPAGQSFFFSHYFLGWLGREGDHYALLDLPVIIHYVIRTVPYKLSSFMRGLGFLML